MCGTHVWDPLKRRGVIYQDFELWTYQELLIIVFDVPFSGELCSAILLQPSFTVITFLDVIMVDWIWIFILVAGEFLSRSPKSNDFTDEFYFKKLYTVLLVFYDTLIKFFLLVLFIARSYNVVPAFPLMGPEKCVKRLLKRQCKEKTLKIVQKIYLLCYYY